MVKVRIIHIPLSLSKLNAYVNWIDHWNNKAQDRDKDIYRQIEKVQNAYCDPLLRSYQVGYHKGPKIPDIKQVKSKDKELIEVPRTREPISPYPF